MPRGADALPHGDQESSSVHMCWEYFSRILWKIIFHSSGEDLNMNSPGPAQSRSIEWRVQESKSDRVWDLDILCPPPAPTSHYYHCLNTSRGRESLMYHFTALSLVDTGLWLVTRSPWTRTLLTATNWAWNLLEQNTTSHSLITSQFSHVVIAKKLLSIWQNRDTFQSELNIISLQNRFQHLFFKLASSSHSNNKTQEENLNPSPRSHVLWIENCLNW